MELNLKGLDNKIFNTVTNLNNNSKPPVQNCPEGQDKNDTPDSKSPDAGLKKPSA